ncbi:porin family protein [Algoriphagus sp. NG3]|uniref:porin family protein n=1 Tax=unclassified Algoriphagus TaxID=2641541 RepID=UPI002A7F1F35|nr:porin family protein [Algoriphagus sp. NG3]WPR75282.1 porin family protein [Algoriphagus sp. NG3]
MKKCLFILFFMSIGFYSHSQVLISLLFGDKLNSPGMEFGLEGGMNMSSLGNMDGNKRLSSLNIGFYLDIRLNDPWYIYTGLLAKSRMGLSNLSSDDLDFLQSEEYAEPGDYSQVLNYFIVPALAKYKLKNHVYFEAGPQFALMHKSWVEYKSDVDGKDARIRDYNKDMINRLDVGVTAGMGYRLMKGNGMTIGLKYYYGFVDVYKDRSGTKNNSLFLKMNIPIGAAKADEN